MRMIINKCYGGFELSDEFIAKYPQFEEMRFTNEESLRVSDMLISAIEEFGIDKAGSRYGTKLKIVEIPNEATDYEIDEYDGAESVICVVDGKIQHIY